MGRKALINSNITHSVSTVTHITRGILYQYHPQFCSARKILFQVHDHNFMHLKMREFLSSCNVLTAVNYLDAILEADAAV